MNNNPIFKDLLIFGAYLFLAAGISYGLHYLLLDLTDSKVPLELINFGYKFNLGITFIFTSTIILASSFLKEQLGFIYLITGALKIGLFFYLIKSLDHEVDKIAFLHIFIPYVVCVVVEIIYIIKILNRINFSKDR